MYLFAGSYISAMLYTCHTQSALTVAGLQLSLLYAIHLSHTQSALTVAGLQLSLLYAIHLSHTVSTDSSWTSVITAQHLGYTSADLCLSTEYITK